MNKKMISALVLGSALVAPLAMASVQYVPTDSSRETKLCMIAAQGSKIQLIQEVRSQRTSVSRVAHTVLCNDQNITAFAYEAGNERVYKRLALNFNPRVEVYKTASLNK